MTEPTEQGTDWHPSHGDFFKAMFDYLKHVSTLATGSIVLLSVFLDKLFKQPTLKWCVTAAVTSFFLSLLASTVVYTVAALNYPRPGKILDDADINIMVIGLLATWIGFLAGIGAITVFFIANWH